jgi:hypothetical protein
MSDVHEIRTILVKPQPASFTFEQDEQNRLFALTGPDGKIEQFCDNMARHLVVEPAPEPGARPMPRSPMRAA